jgi:hypothetical protein
MKFIETLIEWGDINKLNNLILLNFYIKKKKLGVINK